MARNPEIHAALIAWSIAGMKPALSTTHSDRSEVLSILLKHLLNNFPRPDRLERYKNLIIPGSEKLVMTEAGKGFELSNARKAIEHAKVMIPSFGK
jgi:hypothetical protein